MLLRTVAVEPVEPAVGALLPEPSVVPAAVPMLRVLVGPLPHPATNANAQTRTAGSRLRDFTEGPDYQYMKLSLSTYVVFEYSA